MIRAVVDTNIIISAFFWGGIPRLVLDAARAKRFQMITSMPLIFELSQVILRPKFSSRLAQIGDNSASFLDDNFFALVEVVEPAKNIPINIQDTDDIALIACAVGGNAGFIISGDNLLLELAEFNQIKIWSAARFLAEGLPT